MADEPVVGKDFKRSFESSSNWINVGVTAITTIGGIPLIKKMLTGMVEDDRTLYGTTINAVGLFCFAWIVVTLIKVIGNRATAVESAFLVSNTTSPQPGMSAATNASAPTPAPPIVPPPA